MSRTAWVVGSAVAAGVAATLWRRRRGESMDFRGKVVVITGGSRGLGLALARRFAAEGARLALCARNDEELAAAKRDLAKAGAEVLTVLCDVTDRAQVENLVRTTVERYGGIDVLVNNAGTIQVGPVAAMTIEDFEHAMDVMFWGVVYTTLATLPHMRGRNQARIVNITSVGAKVSIPHLIPYSCAKFAAAAFSEGMRSELYADGIKVVTIAPGLMRTGSYLNAVFSGDAENEAAWFSAGATLPGISMGAKRAADQIVSSKWKGGADLEYAGQSRGHLPRVVSRRHRGYPRPGESCTSNRW